MHGVMSLIILLICELIGVWFLNTKIVIPADRLFAANIVFQLSTLTAVISVTQVPYNATIIAHEKMNVYAIVGLFEAAAQLIIAYLIVYNPVDRLVWYSLMLMIVQLIIMLYYRSHCIRHFEETRFCIQKDSKLYKSMLSYSVFNFIGCASVMAQGQALNVVLNVFCGPIVNAARTIAYQVQGVTSQFASNFMTAVTPQIIKLYATNRVDEMLRLVRRSSIFCVVLMYLIFLPLSLEIHFLLKLWLGDYPVYTASFTVLVLVNTLIDSFRFPRINCFHAIGKIKLSSIITGTVLCMALPAGYFMMKVGMSPNSVFWGIIATSCVADVTNMLILKKYISFSVLDFIRRVHLRCVAHIVATSILPVYIYYTLDDGWLRLWLIVLATVISSVLSASLIAFEPDDRKKIYLLIKEKIWVHKENGK
jgi:O-antigen/teichoic acid export membrane protein